MMIATAFPMNPELLVKSPCDTTPMQSHELSEHDILCTQDKSLLKNHAGNKLFRQLIEQAKDTYKQATNKVEKMAITKELVDSIQNKHGLRFVRFDGVSWIQADQSTAREKVGHALRFSIRREKKQSMKMLKKQAQKQESAFTQPPQMKRAASAGYDSDSQQSTSSDEGSVTLDINDISPMVEPLDSSNTEEQSWSMEDVNFLLNETSLFSEDRA